jgi:hypothetical protein
MKHYFKNFFFGTIVIHFFLLLISCSGELSDPKKTSKIFPGFEYSKAVAYDYDGSEKGDLIIEKGKIHHSVKKQVVLNKKQIDELSAILNDSSSYGGDVSRCFKPHLGIVFYDAKEKAKAQVSICFLCNQHNAFPLITAQENIRNNSPSKLHGYSKKGRKKLMSFCESLGFSNCNRDEKSKEDE